MILLRLIKCRKGVKTMRKNNARMALAAVAMTVMLPFGVMAASPVAGAKKAPVATKVCASGVVVPVTHVCPPPRFR